MPMNKSGPQSESAWRLVAVAIGWYILATMPDIVVASSAITYQTLTRQGISQDIYDFLNTLVEAASHGILLSVAFFKGRALGHGDARVGLGDGPTSNRPIIALMAVLLCGYLVVLDIAVPDGIYMYLFVGVSPWRALWALLDQVILGPLAEELFFRGWLWMGLRRHWGILPTAVLTSALFLASHWPEALLSLAIKLPALLALATARHLGRSIRASIALHMMYNLSVPIVALVLRHFGLV
jgi:membrane protease YdiL (CAAX protease family)